MRQLFVVLLLLWLIPNSVVAETTGVFYDSGNNSMGGVCTEDIDFAGKDIRNLDDVWSNSSSTDAAPRVTVIATQGPIEQAAAPTNKNGSNLVLAPHSGWVGLTGVAKANTAGDTLAFAVQSNGVVTTTTKTEGVASPDGWVCAAAASDAECVCNLYTLLTGAGAISGLTVTRTDSGCSDEKLGFHPTPGTASALGVTESDATNMPVTEGTPGVVRINQAHNGTAAGTPAALTIGAPAGDVSLNYYSGYLGISGSGGYAVNFAATYFRVGSDSAYTTNGIYFNSTDALVYNNYATKPLSVYTKVATTAAASGALSLYTGAQSNAGNYASGAVDIYSGATTTDGNTGAISIYSGVAGAGAADAGNISLATNGAPGVGTTGLQILGATGKVDTLAITQGDLGATCTLGQIALDTGGVTAELCICQATNTWYCIAVTDTTGPAD